MNAIVNGIHALLSLLQSISYSLVALLGRFSIAAVFWKSGQTKIEGLSIDLVNGEFNWGSPRLSEGALALFRTEYKLPFIPAEPAAYFAATSEHLFPILILLGFATRFSALALLGMTATIQFFVYPDAYPTHGVWAFVLLVLMIQGPGKFAIDAGVALRWGRKKN